MSDLPHSAQSVTPQLRAWLRAQAGLGHTDLSMLEAMRAAGWQDAVAREVLASTLQTPAGGALPHSKRVAVELTSGRSATWPTTLPSSVASVVEMAWIAARRLCVSLSQLVRLKPVSISTRSRLSST